MDWLSLLVPAVAALAGVALERLLDSRSDRRRWAHEEQTRRRLRGEEVAREARRYLLQAAELFDEAWTSAGHSSSKWEGPPDELVGRLVEQAVDASIEVPDDTVRLFVRNAKWALIYADDANQMGSPPPWKLARAVSAETDAVIGAYLRGERVPPATEVDAAVQAIGAWHAEQDAFHAEQQHEWQERQAEKARARAAAKAQSAEAGSSQPG